MLLKRLKRKAFAGRLAHSMELIPKRNNSTLVAYKNNVPCMIQYVSWSVTNIIRIVQTQAVNLEACLTNRLLF